MFYLFFQTFFFPLIVTTRESWLDREIESIIKYRVYMTVIEDHQLIHVGWRPADGCHDSRSLSSCTMSRRVCVCLYFHDVFIHPPSPTPTLLLIYVTRPITCTVKLLEYRYKRERVRLGLCRSAVTWRGHFEDKTPIDSPLLLSLFSLYHLIPAPSSCLVHIHTDTLCIYLSDATDALVCVRIQIVVV